MMKERDVQPESVRALIQGGAEIRAELVGFLASADRAQNVALLLEQGFDPKSRDEQGRTALHHMFLSDADGDPAIPSQEMLRIMLSHGMDPTARDNDGTTPIDLARTNGDMAAVTMLGVARREQEGQAMRPEPSRTRERSRS
jgi:ankyrin repeat protein